MSMATGYTGSELPVKAHAVVAHKSACGWMVYDPYDPTLHREYSRQWSQLRGHLDHARNLFPIYGIDLDSYLDSKKQKSNGQNCSVGDRWVPRWSLDLEC